MSRDIISSQVIDHVLRGLTVAAMAGSVVIAPNAAQLGEAVLRHLDKKSRERETKRLLGYMRRKELVEFKEHNGHIEVYITERGKQRVQKINFEQMKIQQPKKWDGKWRLVMFDIPEYRRRSRSALSVKLKSLGFYQLQKSAWVHPYPCSVEIELIKQVYEIHDRNIIFAVLTEIDHQENLVKHFKINA